jgi:hemoglobin-like flavoprotein
MRVMALDPRREVAGLSPDTPGLVKKSVGRIRDPALLPHVFYGYVFRFAPAARPLFGDLNAQYSHMLTALIETIGSLDTPLAVEPALRQLGREHHRFGVEPAHYRIVGWALMASIRDLSFTWDSLTAAAWAEVIEWIADIMISGADEAAGQPAWWDAYQVRPERRDDDAVLALAPLRPVSE